MSNQKKITLKEARARLRCGEKFLRAEIAAQKIKVIRVNARVVLVIEESLARYEQARQ